MTTYRIDFVNGVLTVGFGEPAQNDRIVQDAAAQLDHLAQTQQLPGGPLLKINGPASVPVAFVLAHKVAHLYGAIAYYDPKLSQYVVCITHNPIYPLGCLID
jgi:CRISPR-associated protein Csx3